MLGPSLACGPQAPASGSGGSDTTAAGTAEETGGSTGGDPHGGEPFGSGTRLRARYLEAPGGGRHLRNFFDTTLQVECLFFETVDGELRCLPSTSIPTHLLRAGDEIVYFADDRCTIPAIDTATGGTTQSLEEKGPGDIITALTERNTCGARPIAGVPYQLIERVEAGYRMVAGECTVVSHADSTVFSLQPMSSSDFANAELIDEHDVRRLQAEDGAWQNLFALDDDDLPCGPVGTETARCVALPIAIEDVWTACHIGDDLSCRGPSGAMGSQPNPSSCDIDPVYALPVAPDGVLTYGPDLWRLGPTTTSLSCVEDGECVDRSTLGFGTGQTYSPLGEPIPIASLPELTPTDLGDGPVRARYLGLTPGVPLVPSGGTFWAASQWWDERHDAPCYPRLYEDAWWCLPPSVLRSSSPRNFLDSTCQTPLFGSSSPASMLILTADALMTRDPATETEFRETIEWTGPPYTLSDEEGCIDEPEPVELYYRAGTPMDPSTVMSPLHERTQ